MKAPVHLRTFLSESQSEELQKRLATLPFKVNYHEEQHGSLLVACIDCTPSQEKLIQDLMHDAGISASPPENEDPD